MSTLRPTTVAPPPATKPRLNPPTPSRHPQSTIHRPSPPLQPPITIPNPDLRPFFSRIFTSLRHSFAQRRPWFELIDTSTFHRPDTVSEATSRIRKNSSYFCVNYTAIVIIVTALSLLSHPFPLFFLCSLLAAWIYLYLFRPADQPVLLYDRIYSDREILGILIISTIVIVFLTGLGSLLISSVVFGFGIVCVHGAFRVPQEVFVEDQGRPADNGLFSFLVGTAASAAVAATPTVPRDPGMPRVSRV